MGRATRSFTGWHLHVRQCTGPKTAIRRGSSLFDRAPDCQNLVQAECWVWTVGNEVGTSRKRPTPERIIGMVRKAEMSLANGLTDLKACFLAYRGHSRMHRQMSATSGHSTSVEWTFKC